LGVKDLKFADGYGGMRPQIIDKSKQELMLGEAKIEEDGLVFNMTPSPGATSSLAIALTDALSVCKNIGATFDKVKHENEIQSIKSHSLDATTFKKEKFA